LQLSIGYETPLYQLQGLRNFDFSVTVIMNGDLRRIFRRVIVVVRNGMTEENCTSQARQAFGKKEVRITSTQSTKRCGNWLAVPVSQKKHL
jgi:hypothetical protein